MTDSQYFDGAPIVVWFFCIILLLFIGKTIDEWIEESERIINKKLYF
jgi:hypothetical protein